MRKRTVGDVGLGKEAHTRKALSQTSAENVGQSLVGTLKQIRLLLLGIQPITTSDSHHKTFLLEQIDVWLDRYEL